ncbi:MAG: PTS sugar transporter subunit IIA [Anaerolineaceae bacterium]|nr:PTS sugar transporter subunit IIA [Anaerolineaceae bacterium]NTV35533.1 PTS sugar transporter subunit IIA [Anaerolineaceae bacterium]
MTNILQRLLDPAAIQLNLDAETSSDVINCLGNKLFAAGYVRDTFVQAALTRESKLPTGLPLDGEINAAIPHTDCEHVFKAGLAMATLTKPVIFQNMISPEESVPVRLVFVLALDHPKAQVEMLMEVAGVLQNKELIEKLMQATTNDEVQSILAEL